MDFNDTLAAVEGTANALENGIPRDKIIEGLMTEYDLSEPQAKELLLAVENTRSGAGQKRWGSRAKLDIVAREPEIAFVPKNYPGIME